ncbi:NUDIX domain-containing protein [Bacteroidota bacterium]
MVDAVKGRLAHEMGINAVPSYLKSFHYIAKLDKGLSENEIDHIYIEECSDIPKPNPLEVLDWAWVSPAEIRKDLIEYPQKYTAWFPYILENILGQ